MKWVVGVPWRYSLLIELATVWVDAGDLQRFLRPDKFVVELCVQMLAPMPVCEAFFTTSESTSVLMAAFG
jgi:hypothetical protein